MLSGRSANILRSLKRQRESDSHFRSLKRQRESDDSDKSSFIFVVIYSEKLFRETSVRDSERR